MVSQYFVKPAPGPGATKSAAKAEPANSSAEKKDEVIPSPAQQRAAQVAGEVKAESEQTVTVDTQRYHVVFSNRGAVVRNWILKDFKDGAGKPLDLVYQPALNRVAAPFAIAIKGQALAVDPNTALFQAQQSDGGLTVNFEFSDGRALTKKAFRFQSNSYLIGVTSEVTQNGTAVLSS